jgi:hypothetical protein
MKRLAKPFVFWRRGSELNRRIKVLQTLCLRLQRLYFHRPSDRTPSLARLQPGTAPPWSEPGPRHSDEWGLLLKACDDLKEEAIEAGERK